jgi:hypothetical protein
MKKSTIIFIVLLIAVISFFVWKTKVSNAPGPLDDFAKCLTEKGVKMYGAYWCPHCQNQKKMFGNSWQYVNDIECSLPNKAGQTKECADEGITGYPTWDISGERIPGELSLKTLSEKTGCVLP